LNEQEPEDIWDSDPGTNTEEEQNSEKGPEGDHPEDEESSHNDR
jgi:hypothetical protein